MLMSKAQQKSGQSKLSEAPLVGRFAPTPRNTIKKKKNSA